MKNFLITYLFTFSISSLAQVHTDVKLTDDIFKKISEPTANTGMVTIIQDEQLKVLVSRYIEYRRKEGRIPGYRIRIFSDSGTSARQRAWGERSRFLKIFPDIPTYLEYEAPNFKVYVGDFRTKIEGFKAYKQIGRDFKSAFLIQSRIYLPKL